MLNKFEKRLVNPLFSILGWQRAIKFFRVYYAVYFWFRQLGIEYTLELIERHKELAVYRLYKAEIEKRGLKLKGEYND